MADHFPDARVSIIDWTALPVVPTATHAEPVLQETPVSDPSLELAPAGSGAHTARQCPARSVSMRAARVEVDPSPTAVQFPAEGQDTEANEVAGGGAGYVPASAIVDHDVAADPEGRA